ncbi:hypothetical protein FHS95_001830 [Sphingomonas naasensis]|nr:hypothetical protein [Sphingomonas naasensis]NIJ20138.1 hypothetical protein [Sphingomonas naasensis]
MDRHEKQQAGERRSESDRRQNVNPEYAGEERRKRDRRAGH